MTQRIFIIVFGENGCNYSSTIDLFKKEDNRKIDPNHDNDTLLDDCEFSDYLYFMGQWKNDVIPNSSFTQINLVELFSEPVQVIQDLTAKPGAKQTKPNPNVKENKEVLEYKEEGILY